MARFRGRQSAKPTLQSSSKSPWSSQFKQLWTQLRGSPVAAHWRLEPPWPGRDRDPFECPWPVWTTLGLLLACYLLGTDSKASWNLKKFRNSWMTLSGGRVPGSVVSGDSVKCLSPLYTFHMNQSSEDVAKKKFRIQDCYQRARLREPWAAKGNSRNKRESASFAGESILPLLL